MTTRAVRLENLLTSLPKYKAEPMSAGYCRCPICLSPFPRKVGRGRPSRYCGKLCAEYAARLAVLRDLQRAIVKGATDKGNAYTAMLRDIGGQVYEFNDEYEAWKEPK